MNPLRDLTQALTMPFRALFVVGLCGVINAMTYSGHWWVKWVALGMGIATVVALAKGARSLALMALVALAGWWVYRRYGTAARAAFDDWVGRERPAASGVVRRLAQVVGRAA
jgi:hypothetical protein